MLNPVFRLILDPPRTAFENMAIDEMLMTAQEDIQTPPTLRIYSWSDACCYSIGYFQNVQQVVKKFKCREKNIPVVRRITGGGMVTHGADLTFSLALKNPNAFLAGDVKGSYLKINDALRLGLREVYPQLDFADCKTVPSGRPQGDRVCFERPSCYDLLLEGRKVVGASQRRLGGVMLHQSSMVFKDSHLLVPYLVSGFEKKWTARFIERPLGAEELASAARVQRERYGSPEWAYPV